MTMSAASMDGTLSALFDVLISLDPKSPPEKWSELTALLTQDCVTYPMSMREFRTPFHGHDGAIEGFKASSAEARLVERRLVSQTTDVEKCKIICEMETHLVVSGYHLNPFCETVNVRFDRKNRVSKWKRYCCRSPIVAVTQSVTGVGMYSDVSARSNKRQECEAMLIREQTKGVMKELGLDNPTNGPETNAAGCCE